MSSKNYLSSTLSYLAKHRKTIIVLATIILIIGIADLSYAQDYGRLVDPPDYENQEGLIGAAVGALLRFIEGHFGALIMVVAGIGAILAASMGAYRASLGMMVVAVGSFILRALVALFFPEPVGGWQPL